MCIALSLVETFEKGFGLVCANLNKLNHPSPCHLGMHDDVIPDNVFNVDFVTLFLVEHPTVMLNPNCPKHNTT